MTQNAGSTNAAPAVPTKILVLVPTATEGEYSARIFASKAEVKKALNLSELPKGILFYKGRALEPKVKQVVKVSL